MLEKQIDIRVYELFRSTAVAGDSTKHTAVHAQQGRADVTIDLGDGFAAVIKSPPNPPKRYTFADAFEMMKGGTKMKPADYNSPVYVLRDGRWYMNGDCVAKGDVIPWDYLTMDWSEVSP